MPSSHVSLNFHLVFSTKERLPLITKDWRERLHAYLGGIVKGMDAMPLATGGVADHVHLLISLKSKHRLDYFLRDLKADSSNWIHTELRENFEWQKGYGAFSVSPSSINGVKNILSIRKNITRKRLFRQNTWSC